ncbi:hypothetical protein ABTY96_45345 [Streptomyces sp. NPDC096057]|uniref:hypothetical protein n=1 Tax=Streptomyces sp. NPDC096057 TaxID=3155543 RepID=UPI0033343537
MADISSNHQASTNNTYVQSIQILADARVSITRLKGQVDDERVTLSSNYAGEDGVAMQQKFVQWLDAIQSVSNTCARLEGLLNENRQTANNATQANLHAVHNVNIADTSGNISTSQSTYQTMTNAG